jgi:hypothetical protein
MTYGCFIAKIQSVTVIVLTCNSIFESRNHRKEDVIAFTYNAVYRESKKNIPWPPSMAFKYLWGSAETIVEADLPHNQDLQWSELSWYILSSKLSSGRTR